LVLGGVLVVVYGLAQLTFLGGLPAPDGRAARFGNDLLGANNQAASLLLPLAIAVGRALSEAGRARAANSVAALMLLFGIMMTGSRGGLLAMVAVLGAVVLLHAGRRAMKVALVVAAALVLVVVLVAKPGGVGERQLKETSSSGRSDIWAVGLYACRLYCLTGAGGGAFPTVYHQELESVTDARVQERGSTFEPHNIFLLAVIEVGVLGLLLVVLGLSTAMVGALRLPPAMRGPPVAALLGTVVSSFFLSNLEFKFFWAVLAYVAISTAVAAGPEGREDTSPEARERVTAAGEDIR
jgi:O-antigen ligase